jgi:hypothetical protein
MKDKRIKPNSLYYCPIENILWESTDFTTMPNTNLTIMRLYTFHSKNKGWVRYYIKGYIRTFNLTYVGVV